MVKERHVTERLPAYALGVLDEDEMLQVSRHLAVCAACQVELLSFQAVADGLALAAPDAPPPLRLKQQIMDRVQPPRPGPAAEPRGSWWQKMTHSLQHAAPVWGLASLVLIVALLVSNVWFFQRLNRSERTVTRMAMQVIALVGTDSAPEASGTLVISGDGEYGTLVVDGLPRLDEAYQYQLWLIRDGQRISAGVFSVNAEGYGALDVLSPEPLSSYPAFGVTVEPSGGSPGPTGDKVLGGSL